MSKSTHNIMKQYEELQFYTKADIKVQTPEGEGVFCGTTYSRTSEVLCLARVKFGNKIQCIPLSDVEVIK